MKKMLYFIGSSRGRDCIAILRQMGVVTGSTEGILKGYVYIVSNNVLTMHPINSPMHDLAKEYGEEVIIPRFKKGDPVMFKTKSGLWSFGVYHSEGRVDAVIYDKVKTFTCTHMIEFDKFTTNDQLKNIHNSLKTNKDER